jgi:branched-chain amino acid aminotransferase
MPFPEAKVVWKNGQLIPWAEATIHLSSHALHYGTGVFEGIRCYKTVDGPAVFRLPEHMQRWFRSAQVYGMALPYTAEMLTQAVVDVVSANAGENCYIRPLAFFGSHTLRVHPGEAPVEMAILCWRAQQYFASDTRDRGVKVALSRWLKFDSSAMPATAKACGQYINSVLATQDACARGFDEAILLDRDGYLTEGAGENLFLVKDNRLFTNDERSSILLGVTRDTVIELARGHGIPVTIERLKPNDLYQADEAFFSGTAAEITPISSIERRPIGSGARAPVTKRLQQLFVDVTSGNEPKYRKWLTFLPQASG